MEADLIATLICKSNNNIEGVIGLMNNFSLEKTKSIVKFWEELTLDPEKREARMREKADKAAQEMHEKLFSGKMSEVRTEEKSANADRALKNFMGLGLTPELLNKHTKITPIETND